MRDSYQDSPEQARDASLRRLGRLTWRTTQIGALATVGFAVVFARNVPAKTVSVQTPASAKPTASASPTPTWHTVHPKRVTKSAATHPAATQPAGGQPAAQPTAAPTTPRLAPPATPPAPAPTSAAPAPTTSSASTGGG